MQTIGLVPSTETNFSIDKLNGKKYYRVVRTISKSDRHVILEIDEADMRDPSTDPLIIGTLTIIRDGVSLPDYSPRVLWDNRLWRTLDEDTEEFFTILTGIKSEDVKKFAKRLHERAIELLLRSSFES